MEKHHLNVSAFLRRLHHLAGCDEWRDISGTSEVITFALLSRFFTATDL